MNIWDEMIERAKDVQKRVDFTNEYMDLGGVVAAVLGSNNKIYTGVCIDTSCGMGLCAERSAIVSMLSDGEYKIKKVVCIGEKGNLMMPCGVCREFMMQLDITGEIEILKDIKGYKTIRLKELIPNWWD